MSSFFTSGAAPGGARPQGRRVDKPRPRRKRRPAFAFDNPSPTPTPAATPPPMAAAAAGLLSSGDRHLASRFSFGLSRELAEDIKAVGDARAWFDAQLDPGTIADPAVDAMGTWWPSLLLTYSELAARDADETERIWEVMRHYQSRALLRRWMSRRQVLEVMADFWENHLHVPVLADGVGFHRVSYGDLIRSLALTSYAELLQAAIVHPAMGIYLNNAASTKRAINEDLGRELLELHTVGRGNFSEADVRASAMILSGYWVDKWRTWDATYRPRDHATGAVSVLGFTDPNAAADGRPVTARFLKHLALHPLTARRIATKLAKEFVSDAPSASLIDRLATTYLASQSQIVPVLKALVDSPEFARAKRSKVRTPEQDVVATYRAVGALPQAPTGDEDWVGNAVVWQASAIGAAPFGWPRPDGQPRDNDSWTSSGRLLASWRMHLDVANGWWPTSGITYRPKTSRLPQESMRFDDFVAHTAAEVLHTPVDTGLLEACCVAVNCQPDTTVRADSPVVGWQYGRLVCTLLDSPRHFMR